MLEHYQDWKTDLGNYGSERPGAVPLIIRKRSLDAFQHATQPHGRVGVLLGSANTAWHGLCMPNIHRGFYLYWEQHDMRNMRARQV